MQIPAPRNMAEAMRDEMVMRDKIAAHLHDGPKTVPELAEALGFPTREVMLWVMAMRRYGRIEEIGRPNEDGYFEYGLVDEILSKPPMEGEDSDS